MASRTLPFVKTLLRNCNAVTSQVRPGYQQALSGFPYPYRSQIALSSQLSVSRNYSSSSSSSPVQPYSTEAALKLKEERLRSPEDEELDRIGLRREKIEVDGVLLNWDQMGSGEHVVLLLPGIIGCIKNDFGPLFKKMNKEKFTLVSWDPPGYGYSRPPERDFQGIFYQRDGHLVVKLMDKLGHDKFSILGWSNGGVTGGHIASDYPQRVRSLVTWGAHAFADERAVIFTKLMGDLSLWSPKMLKPVLDLYGREYTQKMMDDWHNAVHEFYHEGQDQVFKDGLKRISCPTLVLHGEDDPVLGIDHAEYLRDNIQNSRMFVMPNAKHNLHLRFVDQFVSMVETFLLENKYPEGCLERDSAE